MKRFFTLLTACMLGLLCTACGTVEVSCGVDEGNTAYLQVAIEMDLQGFSAENATAIRAGMETLSVYYRDTLGFTVWDNIRKGGNPLVLDMRLSRSADSPAAAFEQLALLLKDERLSPFTSVSLSAFAEDFDQGYAARLTLNADRLLSTAGLPAFPAPLREAIEKAFAESTATLRLQLPGDETAEHTGELEEMDGYFMASTGISFQEETTLQLVTTAAMPKSEEAILRQAAFIKQVIRVSFGGFILCVLLLLVLFIRRKKGR